MVKVREEFVAELKGCYRSEFGFKIAFTGVAKMLMQPSGSLFRGLAQ